MLADRRAQALVDNFASQWLTIGKLAGVVPDVDAYPEFDENLRDAFRQETRLFVGSQLREDRSVADLLTANYTYVNERLARHYRIPNVYGSHFRRVTFTDGKRGGLLGQGSILTVTSYPNRTSPVLRGRWLLDNVLGAPPPPPPPDVPLLEGERRRRAGDVHPRADGGAPQESLVRRLPRAHGSARVLAREFRRARQMAHVHRRRSPIDASASLPDGTTFEGIAGLRQLVADHREDFARTFTQKLLAYALGRSIEAHDCPRSARSHGTRRPAGTAGRRSSWVSRRARRSR